MLFHAFAMQHAKAINSAAPIEIILLCLIFVQLAFLTAHGPRRRH
jgi:hypothetical protein